MRSILIGVIVNLLLSHSVFFQQEDLNIVYSFDSVNYFNNYNGVYKHYTVDGKLLKVLNIDIDHNVKSEFINFDDKTFYYTQYNEKNIVLSEGKAILENQPFTKMDIPLYDSIGNVSCYKSIFFYKFQRSGKWIERVSDTTERIGQYQNNNREGEWMYVLKKRHDIPIYKEIYVSDKLAKMETLVLFEKEKKEIPSLLQGQWYCLDNPQNWNDTLFYYDKSNETKKDTGYGFIKFTADGKCEIPDYSSNNKSYSVLCKLDEGGKKILIDFQELHLELIILYLTKERFAGYWRQY